MGVGVDVDASDVSNLFLFIVQKSALSIVCLYVKLSCIINQNMLYIHNLKTYLDEPSKPLDIPMLVCLF